MVAKVPGKLRLRRTTCKCDVCGRGFMSTQALRAHQACVHPKSKRVAYKPKVEVIARRKPVIVKKSAKASAEKAKPAAKMTEEKKTRSTVKFQDDLVKEKSGSNMKTEFECPVCSKLFPVYFSAYRHIQKYHCVNDEGMTVSPQSAYLIKPNKIEYCLRCRKRISESHTCFKEDEEDQPADSVYTCHGCEQQFNSLGLFEMHIPGVHNNAVDSFFFPNASNFTMWKENLEKVIDNKYISLIKKEKHQVYNCSYVTVKNDTKLFCPSSIVIQEFSKGVQVSFYKQHYGHKCKEYVIPNDYKKYAITTLMKDTPCYTITNVKSDDNDMYMQFKKLMENIVVDAAKIDIGNLKILLGKALEMTSVLNQYNEDDDSEGFMTHRSMTDKQISDVLEMPLRKRKTDATSTTGKKAKKGEDAELTVTRRIELRATKVPRTELKSTQRVSPKLVQKVMPKIVRKNYLKDDKMDVNVKKVDNKSEDNDTATDEYDDPPNDASETEDNNESGIITPEKNNEDTALTVKEVTRIGTRKKLQSTMKIEENATPNVSPKPSSLVQSPSSFNDSYKSFVDATFKSEQDKVATRYRGERNKSLVKTKMGQFNPTVSSSNTEDSKESAKPVIYYSSNVPKAKADFDYEVQERDDECNILILKI